jgi:hypothetical protein
MSRRFIYLVFSLLSFTGCTVCRECECEKDGQTFQEEECATGINQDLDGWQRYIIEENEYEFCRCVEVG